MSITRRITTIVAVLATAVALVAVMTAGVAGASSGDRNRDKLPDKWEKKYKLSLKVKQTNKDPDRDGLSNLGEYRAGLSPVDKDSDDDGIRDGDENAGTVTSFDGETLVIALAPSGTLTGKVTDATEIKCDDGSRGIASASSHGADDPPGDDRGGSNPTGTCTKANLVKGVKVDEAELTTGGVFEKVELVR
jgi:hypothetical protein